MITQTLPAPYTSKQIADWLCVWNAIPENNKVEDFQSRSVFRPMTQGRLNFLMYVAQGHYLATFGRPLFPNMLFATRRGPWIDSNHYLPKRKDIVPVSPDFKSSDFNSVDDAFLVAIWQTYGTWEEFMIAEILEDTPFHGVVKGDFVELTHEALAYRFHAAKVILCNWPVLDSEAISEFRKGIDKENAEFLARATLGQTSE